MTSQPSRGRGSARPLDLAVLREHLAVDAASPSGLRWLVRGQARSLTGHAGSRGPLGYWIVCVLGCRVMAHRVVWALTHGEDPLGFEIDHIDGDRGRNTPENLRKATAAQNGQNTRARRVGGKSAFKGVTRERGEKRWRASIEPLIPGASKHIGVYATEREAAATYNRAAFARWGAFARLNDLDNPGETISAKHLTGELRVRVGLPRLEESA